MNLEDHLGDIARKARGMSNVSLEAAARAAGLAPTQLEQMEESGRPPGKVDYAALGKLIGLDGAKLQAVSPDIAEGRPAMHVPPPARPLAWTLPTFGGLSCN